MPAETSRAIRDAVQLLVEASHPRKIILFGSHARGESDERSDLDLLVILLSVSNRWDEMVRLQRVLRPLRLPVDVLVYTERDIEDWGSVRGTALYSALREGIVLYDAA